MAWNTPEEVELYWADAADIDPTVLVTLLETANAVCLAYAPSLPDGAVVPTAWKLAEIMQARHNFGQLSGGQNQSLGPDGYEIPVLPLIFAAQQLLRPKVSPLSRVR